MVMVLELLIRPRDAVRRPWEMFFLGLVYSFAAVFLASLIFTENIGLVAVFLTTLGCTYLLQHTIKIEEEKELDAPNEAFLLKEHGKVLTYFMFLFVGFVVAFASLFIFLPADLSQSIFKIQIDTINSVNAVTGNAVDVTGFFAKIFFNNIRVLLFTLIFAFFYGAGSVFILAWNAGVVGVAIGIFARNSIAELTSTLGMYGASAYFLSFSSGLLRYLTHGVFEILAYFMVALAGGIISIAVMRHDYKSPQFRKVILDSADLIVLSVGVLFLAALVEVFITPALF